MNSYDHEDAFRDANLHAGKVTDMPTALHSVQNLDHARVIIADLQFQYDRVFEAFIAGVAWAREDMKKVEKGYDRG